MAKRWNEDDDDLDIDLEFDRVEYMKKEINKGKSTLIAVAIAPIFALVSMSVFNLTMNALISLLIGMLGLVFLKPIYDILNIDIDKIDKKGWVKNGAVYFLTLLAVWIILMNPPFGDFAGPQVDDVRLEIQDQDGDWVTQDEVNVTNLTGDEQIRVVAEVTDNAAVDDDSVQMAFKSENYVDMNKSETSENIYESGPLDRSLGELESGEHKVVIRADDINDNSNKVEMVVTLQG
ncbi:MAG: hypothetical protein V5A66_00020 [Candidatus Thermoplasmatota archaeon]